MKELENKKANSALVRKIATKKAALIKKKREYNTKLSSLGTLRNEIDKLEFEIANLISSQYRF